MIADAHIHLYPPAVAADPAAWAAPRGESYWLACVQPVTGPILQGWPTLHQLLRDMDAAGVERAVIQSWYWENHDTCAESLAWSLAWIAAHPDRLFAFAPFNAKGGQRALDLLDRALESGCLGIGELNPPAQGYAYDDPVFDQALRRAAQANAPVAIHVSEPAGRPFPGKIETPFPALIALAQRHPDTRFIFAHLGGLLPFHELNPHTRKALANVWYDTAAVPLLYDSSVYRKLCDAIDYRRILFGTDYPLRTFPKLQPAPCFQRHLDSLRAADLTDAERDAILGQNLQNLLSKS